MRTVASSGAPRWPVLTGLVILVLSAHLWVLSGGVPTTSDPASGMPRATGDTAAPLLAEASTPPPAARAAGIDRLVAVSITTVRWVPPPLAAPATATPPPPAPLTTRTAERSTKPAPTGTPAPPPAVEPVPVPLRTPDPPVIGETPGPMTDTAAAGPMEPGSPKPTGDATVPAPPEPATVVAAAPQAAATERPEPVTVRRPPATLPASVNLDYALHGQSKGIGYNADARLRWQHDDHRYQAELEISAFLVGSRVQTSRGRVGPEGLMPERFGDKRRSTEKAAHFDEAGGRIRFSSNAPDVALQPGAQDRLSVFLQLAGLLRARPQAYPEGDSVRLQVAGTGGAEEWRFHIGSLQELQLPAGQISARKLTREPRHEHDNRVDIWLAPTLQYLPVRIRVTEADGSQVDQQLRRWPPLPDPPAAK